MILFNRSAVMGTPDDRPARMWFGRCNRRHLVSRHLDFAEEKLSGVWVRGGGSANSLGQGALPQPPSHLASANRDWELAGEKKWFTKFRGVKSHPKKEERRKFISTDCWVASAGQFTRLNAHWYIFTPPPKYEVFCRSVHRIPHEKKCLLFFWILSSN